MTAESRAWTLSGFVLCQKKEKSGGGRVRLLGRNREEPQGALIPANGECFQGVFYFAYLFVCAILNADIESAILSRVIPIRLFLTIR